MFTVNFKRKSHEQEHNTNPRKCWFLRRKSAAQKEFYSSTAGLWTCLAQILTDDSSYGQRDELLLLLWLHDKLLPSISQKQGGERTQVCARWMANQDNFILNNADFSTDYDRFKKHISLKWADPEICEVSFTLSKLNWSPFSWAQIKQSATSWSIATTFPWWAGESCIQVTAPPVLYCLLCSFLPSDMCCIRDKQRWRSVF